MDFFIDCDVIQHDALEVETCLPLEVANELSLTVEVLETLEADIAWQVVVLFAHVSHELFRAREIVVAALVSHRLRFFQF